ncbi:MAG: response regulator transcription factor [Deltaproteobacteria bacterium]|nr:MAG: response regulator transcription factor [Deltaproteobacteria bacterium]
MSARILVVEDDPAIGPQLVAGLLREGFDASLAADGPTGRALATSESFDLVVLDLMLPGEDGFSLLEAWRFRAAFPIIVLTARTGLDDRLQSFQLGASDWLPKPFFLEELVARIRARLGLGMAVERRRVVTVADCEVDLDGRLVCRAGEDIELTAAEFAVLELLVDQPSRAFTRAQIAARALPDGGDRVERTVDTYVYRLRRKLGPTFAKQLRTIVGVGYRLDPG